jgi:hypothetical protein
MWPFTRKNSTPVPAEEILEVQVPVEEPLPHLHELFHGAIVDADKQRQDDLQKLMDNSKLRSYFASTIKAMAEKAMVDSGTCFIGSYGAGVPSKSFSVFMEIFCKTAKELGLKCSPDGEMLRFDAADVRGYLERHSPSRVNVDERVREMLRTGPYR